MVLSNHIIKVIETEYSLIISDIQLVNFIYDLRSIRLLCDEEVETLKDHCLTNKERIFQFIKILKTRSDDDFFRFCSVLKDNQVRNVQNLGRKLEKEASTSKPHGHATSTNQATEANSENLSELEIPLRNLPSTPSCHFIIRKNLVNSICDQLKIIHESSGHILIYGMAGSGKTVTVCQSVTRAADMGYFNTNGCYWMKIGNVSNVALFDQLKILSHDLGIEWNKSVQSVGDLCAYLRNYLQGNSKLSDTLFIFDDIWKKDHYKYLSFAKKSIATSRFLFYENELSHRCIRLLERLTYDEAINLIALLRHDQDDQILRRNPVVKKVIDSCAGLPLAISLIGGCRLQTDKEWSEAKAIISRKSGKIKLANYDFNLYGTFKLSFDVLDEKERKLLESLTVFKRVRIPIQSIASLWNCDEQDADDILMELNNKSLLKYVKESKGYCVVHDLIVDFLQQQIYLQTLKQDYHKILNNKLMDGYSNRCEGRWNTLADDGYFYQNLIYHAILAENNEHLQNILTDFNWMTCKIKSDQTIYNLICDLTDYVNYLKARKESWKEFNQLLLLLKKHQAWLDINKIDVTQWILCTDLTDSWMRERALQLAKDNTEKEFSNLPYWNLSTCSTNRTIQSTYYEACKGFGKNNNDEYISVSNHNVGHLRIIGTENNIREDCKIMMRKDIL
ncbi:Apoptotic protease-activating factor 1 [Trichoplax sp. H2]|nr:Apoptotic protease-activating factor 1 [Trichoplax sp. H2]|eukprot:RDD41618.1 Apoptotic protease-activating factor 1 [Trichoplax sp. H2]